MGVDSKPDLLLFKVINLVEMSKHQVSKDELLAAVSLQFVLIDSKLALTSIRLLEEVELRTQFKDSTANLEANRLEFILDLAARLLVLDLAEVIVGFTVEVQEQGIVPLFLQEQELLGWDCNVLGASVDQGWELLGFIQLDNLVVTVEDAFSLECPVFSCFGIETVTHCCHFSYSVSAADDLIFIKSTKVSVRFL